MRLTKCGREGGRVGKWESEGGRREEVAKMREWGGKYEVVRERKRKVVGKVTE